LKTKLFITGCSGIPARYGGFETFAENISKIVSNSTDVTVFCYTGLYDRKERLNSWERVHRKFLPIPPNGLLSILYDTISILLSLRTADLILILGIGSGVFMPLFRLNKRVKFIIHPDGAEWSRAKWNLVARKYLMLSARLAMKHSDYIILDNKAFKKYIPETHHNKILEITYGADHLPEISTPVPVYSSNFGLMICRAEPENNLKLIAEAFEKLQGPGLIIISNWKQTRTGRKLYRSFKNSKRVFLKDPVYRSPELLQQYRTQCTVYIHGHSAGGTNPSLVEAMFTGCAILAFDTEYNRNTTNNLAYYFTTGDQLIKLVQALTNDQLKESGRLLRDYAKKHYVWHKVSEPLRNIL
jgi:glycosyltransferase involved in cell wall biosynthesis